MVGFVKGNGLELEGGFVDGLVELDCGLWMLD